MTIVNMYYAVKSPLNSITYFLNDDNLKNTQFDYHLFRHSIDEFISQNSGSFSNERWKVLCNAIYQCKNVQIKKIIHIELSIKIKYWARVYFSKINSGFLINEILVEEVDYLKTDDFLDYLKFLLIKISTSELISLFESILATKTEINDISYKNLRVFFSLLEALVRNNLHDTCFVLSNIKIYNSSIEQRMTIYEWMEKSYSSDRMFFLKFFRLVTIIKPTSEQRKIFEKILPHCLNSEILISALSHYMEEDNSQNLDFQNFIYDVVKVYNKVNLKVENFHYQGLFSITANFFDYVFDRNHEIETKIYYLIREIVVENLKHELALFDAYPEAASVALQKYLSKQKSNFEDSLEFSILCRMFQIAPNIALKIAKKVWGSEYKFCEIILEKFISIDKRLISDMNFTLKLLPCFDKLAIKIWIKKINGKIFFFLLKKPELKIMWIDILFGGAIFIKSKESVLQEKWFRWHLPKKTSERVQLLKKVPPNYFFLKELKQYLIRNNEEISELKQNLKLELLDNMEDEIPSTESIYLTCIAFFDEDNILNYYKQVEKKSPDQFPNSLSNFIKDLYQLKYEISENNFLFTKTISNLILTSLEFSSNFYLSHLLSILITCNIGHESWREFMKQIPPKIIKETFIPLLFHANIKLARFFIESFIKDNDHGFLFSYLNELICRQKIKQDTLLGTTVSVLKELEGNEDFFPQCESAFLYIFDRLNKKICENYIENYIYLPLVYPLSFNQLYLLLPKCSEEHIKVLAISNPRSLMDFIKVVFIKFKNDRDFMVDVIIGNRNKAQFLFKFTAAVFSENWENGRKWAEYLSSAFSLMEVCCHFEFLNEKVLFTFIEIYREQNEVERDDISILPFHYLLFISKEYISLEGYFFSNKHTVHPIFHVLNLMSQYDNNNSTELDKVNITENQWFEYKHVLSKLIPIFREHHLDVIKQLNHGALTDLLSLILWDDLKKVYQNNLHGKNWKFLYCVNIEQFEHVIYQLDPSIETILEISEKLEEERIKHLGYDNDIALNSTKDLFLFKYLKFHPNYSDFKSLTPKKFYKHVLRSMLFNLEATKRRVSIYLKNATTINEYTLAIRCIFEDEAEKALKSLWEYNDQKLFLKLPFLFSKMDINSFIATCNKGYLSTSNLKIFYPYLTPDQKSYLEKDKSACIFALKTRLLALLSAIQNLSRSFDKTTKKQIEKLLNTLTSLKEKYLLFAKEENQYLGEISLDDLINELKTLQKDIQFMYEDLRILDIAHEHQKVLKSSLIPCQECMRLLQSIKFAKSKAEQDEEELNNAFTARYPLLSDEYQYRPIFQLCCRATFMFYEKTMSWDVCLLLKEFDRKDIDPLEITAIFFADITNLNLDENLLVEEEVVEQLHNCIKKYFLEHNLKNSTDLINHVKEIKQEFQNTLIVFKEKT
ncbi:MAG: hypothetical protein Tsb0021_11340 [Chlamydiales bacterium]